MALQTHEYRYHAMAKPLGRGKRGFNPITCLQYHYCKLYVWYSNWMCYLNVQKCVILTSNFETFLGQRPRYFLGRDYCTLITHIASEILASPLIWRAKYGINKLTMIINTYFGQHVYWRRHTVSDSCTKCSTYTRQFNPLKCSGVR